MYFEVSIFVFGDLIQLPPVRGAQIFIQPYRFLPTKILWRVFSLVEFWQHGDTTYVDF
jgi:hypothetical protein